MSFSVYAYNNNSENNKVTKSLTAVGEYSGTLKDDTSMVDPVILMELPSVPTFNYAQIPMFNRYYFVTDIVAVRTNLWEIHMHCDVLTTYRSPILNSMATLERQENLYNLYLPDNLLPTEGRTFTQTKAIGTNNSFRSIGFIMIDQ